VTATRFGGAGIRCGAGDRWQSWGDEVLSATALAAATSSILVVSRASI
jgi:hypothetical protein